MPEPVSRAHRIGIAVARFNELVTERLLQGALTTLRSLGIDDSQVTVRWVPGAFELPLAAHWLAKIGGCDGVIVLGAVVRGGTDHYQFVCDGVTAGTMRVQLDLGVPIGFGVLTCAAMDQALARAGGEAGNKGSDAAMAVCEMLTLRATMASEGGQRGSG